MPRETAGYGTPGGHSAASSRSDNQKVLRNLPCSGHHQSFDLVTSVLMEMVLGREVTSPPRSNCPRRVGPRARVAGKRAVVQGRPISGRLLRGLL